eukprot:465015_1
MGNSFFKQKSEQPNVKKRIPPKYICPIAQRIMVNPKRVISSGNIYDELSISKWKQAKEPTVYDPISGLPFASTINNCAELKSEIENYLKNNEHYNNNNYLVHENLEWSNLLNEIDRKFQQKKLTLQHLCESLQIKGHCFLFPNKNNPNNVEWDTDILSILSKQAIPIISFVGAAREGKSTLLNDILGLHYNQPFETSNSPDIPHTKGAWIALYLPPTSKNSEKEEKLQNDQMTYDQPFVLVDMEGLTNQVTQFTEKVFYAIYALSDVIVWNDKHIGSDYFINLMQKLKKTMSNISDSANKPSFLYLRRDKGNFFQFIQGPYDYETFDRYINFSNSFKSFRELNLFSAVSGYQIESRPSNTIPFPKKELFKLMQIIFTLKQVGYAFNKNGNRFASTYYEIEKQLNYINKNGVLSAGMQIIMNDEILKWFLFDVSGINKRRV